MAKKIRLKVDDIFSIPLGNGEVGFGQIINFPHSPHAFIMCVFDYKQDASGPFDMEIICKSPILFFGYSIDAKLYHNDWKIIGNYNTNISQIILPYHRLGTPPDDIYIVDYKGIRLKEIDVEAFNKLYYETSISPIRYENALKAYFKLQEWKEDDYDKLFYKHALKSKEIFENIK